VAPTAQPRTHLLPTIAPASVAQCRSATYGYERIAIIVPSQPPSESTPPDEPIRLLPYDPASPARFAEERAALAQALGDWIVGDIHHVGSTAVPGLETKPFIDILVGVRDLGESRECFEPLARLAYLYAPYLPEAMHWFCKPHPSRRTHHLHLVPAGSQRYTEELAFRDRLRADPKARADYAALKRKLAARFAHDREAYTEGKSAFIRDLSR
jgi:GrpB-like predicted nucleotidyltransferase (UPF0157 family)